MPLSDPNVVGFNADSNIVSFNRKVVENITLSDGTVLPAGTFISMPTAMIARDPVLYEAPDLFRPWRFAQMRDSAPSESSKYQFARYAMIPARFALQGGWHYLVPFVHKSSQIQWF